jgi:hypothetical protein
MKQCDVRFARRRIIGINIIDISLLFMATETSACILNLQYRSILPLPLQQSFF